MKRYEADTRIISGHGAAAALQEYGAQRLLMVTDPFFYENSTAARIAAAAKAQKVTYFHKVKPDPSVELAAEGTALVREVKPDLIVALGGGSAIDCAKAMLYFSGSEARFVAIPTTSGSGSEVTDFAILTHKGVKHPLVDERLRPDMAILDSTLLEQMPKSLIADAGFDVISHALEAYVAANAGLLHRICVASRFLWGQYGCAAEDTHGSHHGRYGFYASRFGPMPCYGTQPGRCISFASWQT